MTKPWFLEHGNRAEPLLLCLHGIGSCGSAFDPQAPLVESVGRRLIAWDAPGYRNSADPTEPFSLDDWADAAAELIASESHQSNGGAADIIGVSWGGVTATRLALRHPESVRTLVLADSSVGAGTTPERATAMRARANAIDSNGLEDFARSRSPLLLDQKAPPELIAEVGDLMMASVRQPSYSWACDSMAEADHRELLGTIAVPTLVVVGESDAVTPLADAEELANGIPGARLEVIANAGHLANQEQPDAFNQLVAEFLSDHQP